MQRKEELMPTYTPKIPEMALYVPAIGSSYRQHFKTGSAVVGVPLQGEEGHIRCYYEGGIYQDLDFAECLSIACGRLADHAPTTAFACVQTEDLIRVGTAKWDPILHGWIISEIDDADSFKAWTGADPILDGTRAQRERAASLLIGRRPDPKALIAMQASVNAGLDPVEALIALARGKN